MIFLWARAPDHLDRGPTLARELDRLRVVAGGDEEVMPCFLETSCDGCEQERMRRIREVEPDVHATGVDPARTSMGRRFGRLSADHRGEPLGRVAIPTRRRRVSRPGRPGDRRRDVRDAPGIEAEQGVRPGARVTGRSVLSRSVKHGTPRNVVSSWMPPESVSTAAASASSERNSR